MLFEDHSPSVRTVCVTGLLHQLTTELDRAEQDYEKLLVEADKHNILVNRSDYAVYVFGALNRLHGKIWALRQAVAGLHSL